MTLFSHRYANKIRTACGLILSALFLSGAVTVILVPQKTFANFGDAKTYVLLAPIPGTYDETSCSVDTMNTYNSNGPTTGNGAETTNCTTDFVTYLKGFFRLIISLSSIIAVLVITYEGFKLAVSTSEGARGEAKDRIQQALIGLGLVLGSYLILNTINPQLTKISFVVDKVADYTGTSAYLQDNLTQAVINERELAAFNARVAASRIANESFSAIATPLYARLAELGDCAASADDEECSIERLEIENKLQKAKDSTGLQAAINIIQTLGDTQFNNLVKPVPNTGDRLADIAQMRNYAKLQINVVKTEAQTRVAELMAKGRTEDAALVLAESNRVIADMNKKIEYRARCPYSDVVTASGGVGGASVTPCI